MRSNLLRFVFAVAVIVMLGLGAVAVFTEAQAGPCRCPLLYAPVQCDHNKVYPNQCVADCHNAKNCVPLPIF